MYGGLVRPENTSNPSVPFVLELRAVPAPHAVVALLVARAAVAVRPYVLK